MKNNLTPSNIFDLTIKNEKLEHRIDRLERQQDEHWAVISSYERFTHTLRKFLIKELTELEKDEK